METSVTKFGRPSETTLFFILLFYKRLLFKVWSVDQQNPASSESSLEVQNFRPGPRSPELEPMFYQDSPGVSSANGSLRGSAVNDYIDDALSLISKKTIKERKDQYK